MEIFKNVFVKHFCQNDLLNHPKGYWYGLAIYSQDVRIAEVAHVSCWDYYSFYFFFSIKIKAVAVAVPRQENVCANTHLNARLWLFHALDAFQYLRMDYTGLLTHWRLLATLVFKERKATAHYWIIEQNSLCRIFINSTFSSQFWRRVLKHSNNYHKGTVQKVITNSWRVFNCCDSRKELYFLNIISIVSDLFTRKSLRVP